MTDESRRPADSRRPARASWQRVAAIGALIAAVAAALILLPVGRALGAVLDAVDDAGVWAPVVVAVLYVPAALLALPGSLLTLAAGFALGLVRGSIAVSIGATLGACAAFFVARFLASDAVAARVDRRPRFRAIAAALEADGLRIVILTRLSPIFPFNFLNYGYGLTRVRFRDYALGSWLGMLPGTIMYVYFGSALTSASQILAGDFGGGPIDSALFWGGLVATVVVTVVVTRVARRALGQVEQNAAPAPDAATHDRGGPE